MPVGLIINGQLSIHFPKHSTRNKTKSVGVGIMDRKLSIQFFLLCDQNILENFWLFCNHILGSRIL